MLKTGNCISPDFQRCIRSVRGSVKKQRVFKVILCITSVSQRLSSTTVLPGTHSEMNLISVQSFGTFQNTSHTTNNRHSSTKTKDERKFAGRADKTSSSYFPSSVNTFLRHICIDPKIYLALSRHSTTIFRNLVAEFGRPVFAELGGEGVILL